VLTFPRGAWAVRLEADSVRVCRCSTLGTHFTDYTTDPVSFVLSATRAKEGTILEQTQLSWDQFLVSLLVLATGDRKDRLVRAPAVSRWSDRVPDEFSCLCFLGQIVLIFDIIKR